MYQIRNDGEIALYDEITQGLTGRDIMKQLAKSDGHTVRLRINSSGGDVFEALALYNLLLAHDDVTVYVDGICASAASIIAMAGNKVIMGRGSMMMIHDPVSVVSGGIKDMQDMAGLLGKIRDNIASVYMSKTNLPKEEILGMMESETWMQSDEAVKLGFADEVADFPVKFPEKSRTYEEGVLDERGRLRELDGLMSPGREEIVDRAKYETFQSAQEVAVDLLRSEPRGKFPGHVPGASVKSESDPVVVASIINRMRGWK